MTAERRVPDACDRDPIHGGSPAALNAAPRADGAESASNNNSANNADSGLSAESANSARSTAEVAP